MLIGCIRMGAADESQGWRGHVEGKVLEVIPPEKMESEKASARLLVSYTVQDCAYKALVLSPSLRRQRYVEGESIRLCYSLANPAHVAVQEERVYWLALGLTMLGLGVAMLLVSGLL